MWCASVSESDWVPLPPGLDGKAESRGQTRTAFGAAGTGAMPWGHRGPVTLSCIRYMPHQCSAEDRALRSASLPRCGSSGLKCCAQWPWCPTAGSPAPRCRLPPERHRHRRRLPGTCRSGTAGCGRDHLFAAETNSSHSVRRPLSLNAASRRAGGAATRRGAGRPVQEWVNVKDPQHSTSSKPRQAASPPRFARPAACRSTGSFAGG